jgi:hypothetical protein
VFRPALTGPDFWTVTTRHGVATLTWRMTGHGTTVPTVFEAWALADDPARALCAIVDRRRLGADLVWQRLWSSLTGPVVGTWESPTVAAAYRAATLALESMPARAGIAVYRCVCGGYLTEHGVRSYSQPTVTAAPGGYRHLDCCVECHDGTTLDRARCTWRDDLHPRWTYDGRCALVTPAECRTCGGYLRVDQESCGDDDCCGITCCDPDR